MYLEMTILDSKEADKAIRDIRQIVAPRQPGSRKKTRPGRSREGTGR